MSGCWPPSGSPGANGEMALRRRFSTGCLLARVGVGPRWGANLNTCQVSASDDWRPLYWETTTMPRTTERLLHWTHSNPRTPVRRLCECVRPRCVRRGRHVLADDFGPGDASAADGSRPGRSAISWRWAGAGGVVFLALGVWYLSSAWGRFHGSAYVVIAGPLCPGGSLV